MLRLRLDSLPFGRAADAQMVGQLVLTNDLTGTKAHGNYTVELRTTAETRHARVEGFDRRAGAWALVRAALDALEVG